METIIEKDLKYIWHPYTQMKDCLKDPPILIKKAKGIKLFDEKGKIYFDTISSWWCNIHGHGHPKIIKAIKNQLKKLDHVMFAGFTHEGAVKLAEQLVKITPKNLDKVFYSDNGSTAVEVALKMSFQYWKNRNFKKKEKFISLEHSYHGDTIGSMSVSGTGLFNKIFLPLMFRSFRMPAPYCYRCRHAKCSFLCLSSLESLLKKKSDIIAGIILEPLLMSAGGMIVYPVEYLRRVEKLAKKYSIHLIADEVATGFGRTGKMFACDIASVNPDFLCLSKGITSGFLPLGVTMTSNEIYQAFYDDYKNRKTFYHGHTYSANPISISAALASLEIFKREKTLERIKKIIPIFHREMEKFRDLEIVGDVRYIGMVGALELVKNKMTKESFEFNRRIGYKIYLAGLKEGLILRPLGDIIYFFLPLCIKEKELILILDKTRVLLTKISNCVNKKRC